MSHTLQKLAGSQVQLQITIPPAEYQTDLGQAAARLSERAAIKGFRPGKAPYEIIKQQLGEMPIMEEAMKNIVQRTYFAAVKTEKLETIGAPQIAVAKIAPGNDLVYTATVALLPKIQLPDLSAISVTRQTVAVGDKETTDALENLRKLQPKEVIKNGAATKEDKLVVALEMFINQVPVEGGQAPNHQVYLNEPHYIPGLAEQLVGLKKDDTKEFTLKFPAEHYQKHLAGRAIDFKVKVKDVFALQYPELNDEFAKTLGQESLAKLRALLQQNLQREAERKEEQRREIALLDQLIEKTQFDELPQILVDSEKRKMFYELKGDLERRGIPIEKYLADLKKTEAQIFTEFTAGAAKRAQAALVSRQVARENNIKVTDEEIKQEVEAVKQAYPDNQQVRENLQRPEVIDTIASTVQNRKVIEFLKTKTK
ncbi:MAG: trigger factor [Candidatus Magasanikbacteria bacterium]|nr:trigger factor [Candidatus Magasanikbacteria bacterium]